MEVSIIIVNWNSIDYLRGCIDSIYEHTTSAFEVIVVDNASPAGDGEALEQECSRFKLIKCKENLGFAAANNLGFKNSCGKFILFLNPDTKVVSPAIDHMVRALATTQDGGVLGCTLLNGDMSVQTSCIQTFPTILNQFLDSDWLRSFWPHSKLWGTSALTSKSKEPSRVEVISGACMLVRREVFERAGLFSEEYFMYAEDLDLCYKVEQMGKSNYYLGEAQVIHYGGKSSNFESATRMKWRSITHFCSKHRGHFYSLVFRLVMVLASFGRLTLIAAMGLFGDGFASLQSRRIASKKWRLVVGALLTPFAHEFRSTTDLK